MSFQDLKTRSQRILNLVMAKLSEEYLFLKSDIIENPIEFNAAQIDRQLSILYYDKNQKTFVYNANNFEVSELINKVQSIKAVDKYSKIKDIEVYVKELCKHVLNSKNFMRKTVEEKEKMKEQKIIDDKKQSVLIVPTDQSVPSTPGVSRFPVRISKIPDINEEYFGSKNLNSEEVKKEEVKKEEIKSKKKEVKVDMIQELKNKILERQKKN